MPKPDLSTSAIDTIVNTRDTRTGVRFPPAGLQPYHAWLVDTLHRLATASAADYLVTIDERSPTSIHVAPGRASIGGVPLTHGGSEYELAAFNNKTALIWLADDGGGSPLITFALLSDGGPDGAHIKLAEVTLVAGSITTIVDRRFESILSA